MFHFTFNSLAVIVEDSSSSCCVTVKVFPHMTTATLKQQVCLRETEKKNIKCSIKSQYFSTSSLTLTFLIWFSILPSCPDVSRIWLPPTGAALGYWPVLVHWPANPRLLRCSPGWRHSLPVPLVSSLCSLDPAGPAAGSGERPPPQSPKFFSKFSSPCYLPKRPLVSRQTAVHYPPAKTPQQQQCWWVKKKKSSFERPPLSEGIFPTTWLTLSYVNWQRSQTQLAHINLQLKGWKRRESMCCNNPTWSKCYYKTLKGKLQS